LGVVQPMRPRPIKVPRLRFLGGAQPIGFVE
jgi:hypothetical protein